MSDSLHAAPCGVAPTNTVSSGRRRQPADRGRVLVVDDELLWLRSITRTLEGAGYDVVPCSSAAKAIDILAEESFDVVLSDIGMPELDGTDLLRHVRQRDMQLPVVLITGVPTVSTAVKAVKLGAFHYLTKPVRSAEVKRVIDRAVRARGAGRVAQRMNGAARRAEEVVDVRGISEAFQRALKSLWIAYQPIVNARDGSAYGHEALLRTTESSLPNPHAVLDAAERLEKLDLLGRTIRERAAEPFLNIGEAGFLFVNLHTADLLDDTLFEPDSTLSKLASRVVLEITERASLERIDDLRRRIATLREMGFRIAVDDLGAGYAGLTSFAVLEPEIVKLDMTLVRDVQLSPTKQKLIRSVSGLCQDMGMLVVAEGVETLDEREVLVSLGCDLLQGYLLAKPGRPFPAVSW